MGHVPAGPVPEERTGDDVPRRQHRGAGHPGRSLTGARLARFGEHLAADFLARRGASILGRNVRVGRGEIDLLVALAGRRVAVEVKTRRAGAVDPADNFTAAKAQQVRRAALGLDPPLTRIDLVTVTVGPAGVDVRWVPFAG